LPSASELGLPKKLPDGLSIVDANGNWRAANSNSQAPQTERLLQLRADRTDRQAAEYRAEGGVKLAAPIGPVTLSGQLSMGQTLTAPGATKFRFDVEASLPISLIPQENEVKVEPYVQVKSEVPLSGGPTSFDPSAGIKASAKLNEDTQASLKFQWGPKDEEMLLLQISGQL
jgi:hypothetical protein